MAFIEVKALVGKQEMEIILDDQQWVSLTVDGNNVEPNSGGGFSKTVKLTMGVKVPFVAIVSSVEIINGNFNHGVNGNNYDGYWLTIDYTNVGSDVQLSGTLEWRNGYIHDAPTEYTFSQGKLGGVFKSVS